MVLFRNKNTEKFSNRYIPHDAQDDISPHPIHSDFNTLNRAIDFANDAEENDRGVVKTIVSSDRKDYYSVALEQDDHDMFDPMYEQVNDTVYRLSGDPNQAIKDPERLILKAAYQTVRGSMKTISRDKSVEHVRKYAPHEGNTLVSLEAFVRDGVGASEHQAMAAAGLLRRFTRIGALRGEINIDTSIRDDKKTNKRLHSSWLRHTDRFGNVTIIDPANNYFGSLASSITDSKIDYMREADLENPRIYEKTMAVMNQTGEREAKAKEGVARKLGQKALGGWLWTESRIKSGLSAYNKRVVNTIDRLIPDENSASKDTLKSPNQSLPD